MNPFKTASSIATPLDRTNVDTDQIIPKQFLKSTERTGFGKNLFYGWRYDSKGEPVKDFILNNPAYDGSQVLVAGENFGCGSSREHAAWAILDRGFSVVAAPSFADIFYNNCIKNGILPVRLEEKSIATILKAGRAMMQVDLVREECHFLYNYYRKCQQKRGQPLLKILYLVCPCCMLSA